MTVAAEVEWDAEAGVRRGGEASLELYNCIAVPSAQHTELISYIGKTQFCT